MAHEHLPKCPRCRFRMVARLEEKRLWCQICGYSIEGEKAKPYLKTFEAAGGEDPYAGRRRAPNRAAEQALMEAERFLRKGDENTARFLADEVLREDHRVLGAYEILFAIAKTPIERAKHLASILAIDPHHKRAQKELQKLKPIVGEDVTPSFSTVFDHRERVDNDLAAQAEVEQCPMCGAQTLYAEDDEVKCLACGYKPDTKRKAHVGLGQDHILQTEMPPGGGFHPLRQALWERKYGGGREWIVARHVLACENCGAQLTLSGNMMTDQCAFCDSQHILERDALGSFQEPDAVLVARLNREQAEATMREHLPYYMHHSVVRTESVGLFLPFWEFKGVGIGDVLIPGCKEPSEEVLKDILPYDLDAIRPYDQRYLASWSAELYTQDAIQSSIYAQPAFGEHIDSIEYRLLLLPSWAVTMHLIDGSYYHAFVNAQTGEVVVTERVDSGGDYRSQAETSSVIKPLQPSRTPSIIKPLPPRHLD